MKTVIFFIALFGLLPACYAQKADTAYYDADWNSCYWKIATYYKVIYPKNEDGHYKVEGYYSNANKLEMTGYILKPIVEKSDDLKMQSQQRKINNNDFKDGEFVYYGKDGNVIKKGKYINDKEVETWKYYFDSSDVLWFKANYKDGKLEDTLTSYYKDGKLKRIELYQTGNSKSGECFNEDGSKRVFTPFTIMPAPNVNINEFLSTNLVYPREAREKGIEGKVYLKFIVNEDGSTSNLSVEGDPILNKEAVKVFLKMPKWKPGIQDDKAEKVYFTLPVNFKLT